MRKELKLKLTLFFVVSLFKAPLFCDGTNTGNILIQSLSAKSQGLGETYTAFSMTQGDLTGFQYNPASLGFMESKEASLTYKSGIFGDGLGVFSFGTPLKMGPEKSSVGNTAATFLYYSFGDIEYIDAGNNKITASAQKDFSFILSYGIPFLWPNLSLGTNGKVLHSKLADKYSATAFAADVGALFKVNSTISLGASLLNMGTKLQYDQSSEQLPFTFRVGLSHERKWFSQHKTLFGVDGIKRRDEPMRPSLGLEYLFDDGKFPIALRMGYKFNSGTGKLNAGLGLPMKQYKFDYSMQLMGSAGASHFITVGFLFGESSVEAPPQRITPQTPKKMTPLPAKPAPQQTPRKEFKRW